jgi:hypothetical protein
LKVKANFEIRKEKLKHSTNNKRFTEITFRTTPTVPAGLVASGIWKMALCLFGSNGSFVGSNFSTPCFLSTCKQQMLILNNRSEHQHYPAKHITSDRQ